MVRNCLNISAIKEMLANSYIGPNDFYDIAGPGGSWLYTAAHLDDSSIGHCVENLHSRGMPRGFPFLVPELYAIPRQSPSLAVVHNLRDRHVLHIHPALSGDDFRPSGSWQTGSPLSLIHI